jgi:putative oxidoreductase
MLLSMQNRALAVAEAIPGDLVALAARVAAGYVFWSSGQTKLDGFAIREATFFLFREEYRLPLIPPDAAAVLATVGENLFSVLLVLGLAARLSAATLLVMTGVIQVFVYPEAWPVHLLWSVALLVVVRQGPGRLSLDHLLFRMLRSRSPGAESPKAA